MSEWPVDRELDEQLRRMVLQEVAAADHRQIRLRRGPARRRPVLAIALAVAASLALVGALAWRTQMVPIAADETETPTASTTDRLSPTPQPTTHDETAQPSPSATSTGTFIFWPNMTAGPTANPASPASKTFDCSEDGGFVVSLRDGRVLVGGTQCAAIFDPKTRTFRSTGSLSRARGGETATLLPDGRVLITGGIDWDSGTGANMTTDEIYDPASGRFTPIGPVPPHAATATAILKDGRVLIVGANLDDTPDSAEVFDPKTGALTAAGPLAAGLAVPALVALDDGRVLVADTFESNEVLTQVYDPATNSFRPTLGQLDVPLACASPLPDGRVMTLADGASQASAYDAASDTFRGLAVPSRWPVEVLTCTKLSDGRILAIGQPVGEASGSATGSRSASAALFDRGATSAPVPRTEFATEPITLAALIYNPAADRWTYLGHLNRQRLIQSVGLASLPNGGALVVGDEPGGSSGSTAELFDPKTNKFHVND